MKTCRICKIVKEMSEFGRKHDSKDGFMTLCKYCNKKHVQNWKNRNPEKAKDTISSASKKWYGENKEVRKESMAIWQKLNPSKCRAIDAKRRSAKLQRIPKWLTKLDLEQIQSFYDKAEILSKKSGISMEVDHILPLQGLNYSGLHVPWNLQIITATENRSKGNR